MKKNAYALLTLMASVGVVAGLVGSCAKNKNNSSAIFSLPLINGQVLSIEGSSLSSTSQFEDEVSAMAANPNIRDNSSYGGGFQAADDVFGAAKIFFEAGKEADKYSCVLSAMVNYGVLPNPLDGTFKYIVDTQTNTKVRFKGTGSGNTVSTFSFAICNGSTQLTSVSGDLTATQKTVTLKTDISSVRYVAEVTGDLFGSNWTNKTVHFRKDGGTVGTLQNGDVYMMLTQNSSSIVAKYFEEHTTDIIWVGAAFLGGSTYSTGTNGYYLGKGSMKPDGGSTVNWNNAGVSGNSNTYTPIVNAATQLTQTDASNKFNSNAFTASEQWDCSTTSPIDIVQVASNNQAFYNTMNACLAQ